MLSHFVFAIRAVLPIELLVILGIFIRRIHFFDDTFFATCDKLVFYIMMPCSIFTSLYSIDLQEDLNFEFIGYLFLSTTLLFILGVLSGKLLIKDKERNFGVSVMTVFRANTAFIGIPLATSVCGAAGTAAMAASLLIALPFFNLYTVMAFNNSSAKELDISLKKQVVSFIKNPLIVSCIAGISALVLRGFLPLNDNGEPVFLLYRDMPSVFSAMQSVGSAALSLALISVGAQLRFDFGEQQYFGDIAFGCVWKMILSPLIFVGLAVLLTVKGIIRFTPGQMTAILAHFATPASVTAASLTQEMGGNSNLCRQYILITNIMLIFTLPVFITALMYIGVI